ncbi:type III secretion system stalk subunit SctO [Phyllobacterium myrsinacearum]|uniref:Type III secretion protein n=1 Tax=Phyllobacterium myrsinacearum TaxID=28101 RepID=A0A2S9JP38_9HYPH|nr:YscO family type III secretion system apparatus protein [Phyllobacterium myrsinacearum]PRD55003.1 hypothetical protein C5750_07345 [Phyllobacterium myrsinacearum]PWV90448.1 type III secretion system (T3SS) protein YscO [Phyllobacterium myrsinacearum]RZV05358.1 type III secretion system (T3SS) protein YscO [Phyllobacterium myrsinacearum]
MNQQRNLQKLMELRKLRMKIAEEASIRQQHIHDAASKAVEAASGQTAEHEASRLQHESVMYEHMSKGPVKCRELDRYRDALSTLNYQAIHLKQQEEEAKLRLVNETMRKDTRAAEHLAKLRQHDKLKILMERQSSRKAMCQGLLSELDDEDQVHSSIMILKGRRV